MDHSEFIQPSKKTAAHEPERAVSEHSRGDQRLAYAFLRIVLGVNIFLHGATRFLGQPDAFLTYVQQKLTHAPLVPTAMLPLFAAVLPWVEAAVGLLLIIGLLTRIAIVAGALLWLVFASHRIGIWLACN